MRDFIVATRLFAFWTVVLGIVYPLFCTGISQILFADQANGGIIKRGDQIVGSHLIGQKFESDRYFWSRPSAVDYNPLPSGGSNSGPTSEALKTAVREREAKLKASNPGAGEPPQDLLFASASGLDPHISPEAASYQVDRIVKIRSMAKADVLKLVASATNVPQFGILGESTVNVLQLNNALDAKQGLVTAPKVLPLASPTPTSGDSLTK